LPVEFADHSLEDMFEKGVQEALIPDKITIFRGPIQRLAGPDPERLRSEIRHVVLHEVAHHFGISDQRLIEIDRY
jgi:predicted Zn-dependent protease with MMP-like domain